MNKIAKIATSLFWVACSYTNPDLIDPLEKILSKNYNVEFSVRQYLYTKNDSVRKAEMLKGTLTRSNNYVCSKSNYGIGIFEDSNFFYLDTIVKVIQFGPKEMGGTIFLVPFYDPFEIISYAKNFSTGFIKYYEGKTLVYDFTFHEKNMLVYNIRFTFENKNDEATFNAEIVYQRGGMIGKDLIDFKYLNSSQIEGIPHISDFFKSNNGKDSIVKKEFHNYTIFNLYPFLKK